MTVRLRGLPGAPGVAIGPVWRWSEPATGDDPTGRAENATLSIDDAAARAASQLGELAERMRALGRPSEADIFDAQALMATDESLLGEARRRAAEGEPAPGAVTAAAEAAAAMLAALDDETLSARAADVRDVGARIVRVLSGRSPELPAVPSIAVADDLPPSIAAEIPDGLLLGIALEGGSPTAHAVILARSLGIPAVVGIAGLARELDRDAASGSARATAPAVPTATLDGSSGELVVAPSAEDVARIEALRDSATVRAARARGLRGRPGSTADGVRVALLANVGRPTDFERALDAGAEGIGLFRTEFLFMGRDRPPSEAEQTAVYRQAFEAFGTDRPVVVRLADIGGDKDIPYLDLPPELNPFLGVRAIRLAIAHRDLLLEQFRAIWRAGGASGVVPHVMAPMVATLADVETLVGLRDEARGMVIAAGDRPAERIVTGIMVELPAACVLAPELAGRVDFFSIGTNDLTQYLFAADRGNAALAAYQDALHPAVLRSIAAVVAAADAAGIPVAVCGELAGDPAGALVLAGIGVDELSMDPGSLDAVRLTLAGVSWPALEALGAAAVRATDASSVRALSAQVLAGDEGPENG